MKDFKTITVYHIYEGLQKKSDNKEFPPSSLDLKAYNYNIKLDWRKKLVIFHISLYKKVEDNNEY